MYKHSESAVSFPCLGFECTETHFPAEWGGGGSSVKTSRNAHKKPKINAGPLRQYNPETQRTADQLDHDLVLLDWGVRVGWVRLQHQLKLEHVLLLIVIDLVGDWPPIFGIPA